MRKAIKPRNVGRGQVTPAELGLGDLILLVQGWAEPRQGEDRNLTTESLFHDFLRQYGADLYNGPHPPGGYDLDKQLEEIETDGPDPRDAA